MKMSIHGKQLVVTDAIKKYAETKLGRVEKYHDSIIDLDVSLSAVRTKTGSSHTAEVLAYLSGSTLKASCTVLKIPFYDLKKEFKKLDQDKTYLLYCDKGVLSQLHGQYLKDEQKFANIKVYRPN